MLSQLEMGLLINRLAMRMSEEQLKNSEADFKLLERSLIELYKVYNKYTNDIDDGK